MQKESEWNEERKINKTKNTRDKWKNEEFERKGYWLKKSG